MKINPGHVSPLLLSLSHQQSSVKVKYTSALDTFGIQNRISDVIFGKIKSSLHESSRI